MFKMASYHQLFICRRGRGLSPGVYVEVSLNFIRNFSCNLFSGSFHPRLRKLQVQCMSTLASSVTFKHAVRGPSLPRSTMLPYCYKNGGQRRSRYEAKPGHYFMATFGVSVAYRLAPNPGLPCSPPLVPSAPVRQEANGQHRFLQPRVWAGRKDPGGVLRSAAAPSL